MSNKKTESRSEFNLDECETRNAKLKCTDELCKIANMYLFIFYSVSVSDTHSWRIIFVVNENYLNSVLPSVTKSNTMMKEEEEEGKKHIQTHNIIWKHP